MALLHVVGCFVSTRTVLVVLALQRGELSGADSRLDQHLCSRFCSF